MFDNVSRIFYIARPEVVKQMTGDMPFEEKTTWLYGAVSFCSYPIYLGIVLSRARGIPLAEVACVAPLLWVIGGTIAAMILGCIVMACIWPRDVNKKDVRDRQIGRFGDYVGQSFLCMGGMTALILSVLRVDHFWIANAIYLSFFLSGVLSSVSKITAYRQGFPWD